ncbi:MAG: DUF4185 domain-containing protein [Acidobacteriota bacterium]
MRRLMLPLLLLAASAAAQENMRQFDLPESPTAIEPEAAIACPADGSNPAFASRAGLLSTICQLSGPVYASTTQVSSAYEPHNSKKFLPPYGFPDGWFTQKPPDWTQPFQLNVTNRHASFNSACDLNTQGIKNSDNYRRHCPTTQRIVGTDLGVPAVVNNRLVFLWGDTSAREAVPSADLRNLVSSSSTRLFSEINPNLCIQLAERKDGNGKVRDGIPRATFSAYMAPVLEQSKSAIKNRCYPGDALAEQKFQNLKATIRAIPVTSVEVGGRLYVWYMASAEDGCGLTKLHLMGLAASDNSGESFNLVPGGFWGPEPALDTTTLPRRPRMLLGAVRTGTTIYTYWSHAYRDNDVYVARVPQANVGDPSQYEWYSNDNTWKKPVAPARFRGDSRIIFGAAGSGDQRVGEFSIQYNDYIKGYLALYFGTVPPDTEHTGLYFRIAKNPWGPFLLSNSLQLTSVNRADWKRKVQLPSGPLCFNQIFTGNYGAFHHQLLTKRGGRDVFFVISSWGHYNSFLMKLEIDPRFANYFGL